MMRKKHLIQNNSLNKTKDCNENPTTKVTVQYIQEEQLIQNTNDENHRNIIPEEDNAQDEIEVENVEYLEDHANVEYIEDPNEKEELDDTFYPNAIHCLLDLYKTKYEALNGNEITPTMVVQIWREIAKDMQESYFEFNERQIQHKYALLREQYFAVQSKEDIENFDYFEQLHDIYKDPGKSNILKGLKVLQDNRPYYKDELLLQAEHLEVHEGHLHDFKSEEIVHKEHEFIDMVEKELQAMEDGTHLEDINDITETTVNKVNEEVSKTKDNTLPKGEITKTPEQNLKRTRNSTLNTEEEPPLRKQKTNEKITEINVLKQEPLPPSISSLTTIKDFTLLQYNEQQERRHREKMSLLEKSLQIQERALEQQNLLLQELIKRLPS